MPQSNSMYADEDIELLPTNSTTIGVTIGGGEGTRAPHSERAHESWPEPEVKLELVAAQLNTMVKQGKEDAEAARVASGFLGGSSWKAIALWLALAIYACYAWRGFSHIYESNPLVGQITRDGLQDG